MLLKKGEANHHLSQVKQLSHNYVNLSSAKLAIYFKLSNTWRTAFVAIDGVTEM